MPILDFLCPVCGVVLEDQRVAYQQYPRCSCGGQMEPFWATSFPNVIGDAMDYWDHNLAPEPVHITSKAERQRLMKARGLVEKIRHVEGSRLTRAWY